MSDSKHRLHLNNEKVQPPVRKQQRDTLKPKIFKRNLGYCISHIFRSLVLHFFIEHCRFLTDIFEGTRGGSQQWAEIKNERFEVGTMSNCTLQPIVAIKNLLNRRYYVAFSLSFLMLVISNWIDWPFPFLVLFAKRQHGPFWKIEKEFHLDTINARKGRGWDCATI